MVRRSTPTRHRPDASFEDVLAAARRGQQWAFRTLYDTLSPPVTAFVRARTSHDTDDIINEIFLGAFKNLAQFNGNEHDYRAWVFRIARNKINDHHRRAYRQVEQTKLEPTTETSNDHATAAFTHHEQREHIEQLLTPLTPDQRDVILLRVLADLSIAQVAEILDKPPGAIKSMQHRAMETLRRHNLSLAVTS